MTNPIATCRLWCRDGESLVEFEIALGMPQELDGKWFCDWSLGALGTLGVAKLDGTASSSALSSMKALASAQSAVVRALEFREGLGCSFYTDAGELDLIEDLRAFLPSVQRRRPEKKRRG
jgi:hypothetical protein